MLDLMEGIEVPLPVAETIVQSDSHGKLLVAAALFGVFVGYEWWAIKTNNKTVSQLVRESPTWAKWCYGIAINATTVATTMSSLPTWAKWGIIGVSIFTHYHLFIGMRRK